VIDGDFFDQYQVPKSQRVIRDIAISGNGEPTSLKALDEVIELIGQISTEMGVFPNSHFVLISNGSLMHQQWVQKGLKVLNKYQGQVWFKLDSATEQGRVKINNSLQTNKKILENLKITTELCETLIQTCLFEYLGTEEIDKEYSAYVELFKQIQHKQIRIKKIMLYTLARPSLQPESKLLRKLNEEEIMLLAKKLELLDYKVTVSC
jgi:wyosine [tRNA(Phe)-imidazoG37] synthetase (radical SAM superfamily)